MKVINLIPIFLAFTCLKTQPRWGGWNLQPAPQVSEGDGSDGDAKSTAEAAIASLTGGGGGGIALRSPVSSKYAHQSCSSSLRPCNHLNNFCSLYHSIIKLYQELKRLCECLRNVPCALRKKILTMIMDEFLKNCPPWLKWILRNFYIKYVINPCCNEGGWVQYGGGGGEY